MKGERMNPFNKLQKQVEAAKHELAKTELKLENVQYELASLRKDHDSLIKESVAMDNRHGVLFLGLNEFCDQCPVRECADCCLAPGAVAEGII
jgi:septal ring factor EnvC (AmiA/AmiB activator)